MEKEKTMLEKMEITWLCFVTIAKYTRELPDDEFGMGMSRVIRDHWVGEMLGEIASMSSRDIDIFGEADQVFEGDILLSLIKHSERDAIALFLQMEDKYVWKKYIEIEYR